MNQLLLLCALLPLQQADGDEAYRVDWGRIQQFESTTSCFWVEIKAPRRNQRLLLPNGLPPVVGLSEISTAAEAGGMLEFNAEATAAWLIPTSDASDQGNASHSLLGFVFETAERSAQLSEGRIVFAASDAEVVGKTARLESQPLNQRIGFWTDSDDSVRWSYQPTRPGKYEIALTYSLADGKGSEIEVELGEKKHAARLPATGSWYRYRTLTVATGALSGSGPVSVIVRCTEKTGTAVMNLKSVILRPTSEGEPIVQADDGTIVCHARDVVIHGVKVQYEPRPEKNTVGFWVNPDDRVSWEFEVRRPGEFDVEILQGCGKGQGGSEVELKVGLEKLRFEVEDTGHFQNFKPRIIGTVSIRREGPMGLTVRPLSKPGIAVMDLRQVRLIPREKK